MVRPDLPEDTMDAFRVGGQPIIIGEIFVSQLNLLCADSANPGDIANAALDDDVLCQLHQALRINKIGIVVSQLLDDLSQ